MVFCYFSVNGKCIFDLLIGNVVLPMTHIKMNDVTSITFSLAIKDNNRSASLTVKFFIGAVSD